MAKNENRKEARSGNNGNNGNRAEQKGKSSVSVARPAKVSSSASAGAGIDFAAVRELARIAGEFNLAEVEADPSGRVRVRRDAAPAAEERAPVRSAAPAIALAPPPPVEGAPEPGTFITSPFVGTFYRSPSPNDPAFVEAGQTVRKGQVVCIVEAMKLMNEIESEADGKIAEVLVQNGEHVEYGQHLFRLAKS